VSSQAAARLRLHTLVGAGWVFACVSNDPNSAVASYNEILAAAGAPMFRVLANGERAHVVRVGAALAFATAHGAADRAAATLQAIARGTAVDDSDATLRPLVHWASLMRRSVAGAFADLCGFVTDLKKSEPEVCAEHVARNVAERAGKDLAELVQALAPAVRGFPEA
jgi:hypothetical protein